MVDSSAGGMVGSGERVGGCAPGQSVGRMVFMFRVVGRVKGDGRLLKRCWRPFVGRVLKSCRRVRLLEIVGREVMWKTSSCVVVVGLRVVSGFWGWARMVVGRRRVVRRRVVGVRILFCFVDGEFVSGSGISGGLV